MDCISLLLSITINIEIILKFLPFHFVRFCARIVPTQSLPLKTRLVVFPALFALLALSDNLRAASITWTGAGATNNWSEAANWSAGVPGSSDVAIFDATSVKNVLINTNVNVLGIAINTGYSGTMTQGAGFTITAGTSNFSQADGNFVGGNSSITVTGAYDLAGGTFTATSGTLTVRGNFTHTVGGSFVHNSGTVSLSTNAANIDVAGSETFYHLTFTSGIKTVASGDTLIATGNLSLTDGSINTGTVSAQGNISQASTFDGGTGLLSIDGNGAQTFTGSATTTAGTLPATNVNKPAGTLTLSGTIRTTNPWTYSAGTLDAGTSTLVLAGTLTATGSQTLNALQIRGAVTVPAGTTLTVNSSLTMPSAVAFTVDGTVVVLGALSLTDGSLAGGGTFKVQGSISQGPNFDGGSRTLVIDGAGAQTFTGTATSTSGLLPPININKPAGTLTLSGTIRTTTDWTYSAGTLDPGTSLIVFATSGAASTQTITGTQTLTNVQIAASGHKSIANSLTVTGTLTLSDGFLDTGTINAIGAVVQASTFDGGSGALLINGAGSQTLTGSATASAGNLPPVTINKTSGTLILAGTIRTMSNWTYMAGTLDPGSSTVVFAISGSGTQTIAGAHTLGNVQCNGSGHFSVSSSLTVTGLLTLTDGFLDTGTVNAQGNIAEANTFDGGTAQLVVNGSGTQTLTGSTTTAGSLPSINLNKPAGTLTLVGTIRTSGNWTYTAGSLDPGSSLVVFAINGTSSTQNIAGAHTLSNVEITGTGHKSIISSLTVTGMFTLTNGFLDTGTVYAQGDLSQGSGDDGGTADLVINGTGSQAFVGAATASVGALPRLTINKPSSTLTLSGTIRTSRDWTYVAGVLDAGSSNLIFAGTQTITGSHTLSNVEFTNANHRTVASGTQLVASGTLLLTNGYIDTGTVEARGNISQISGFDGGTGLILLNGTGNQTLTGGGSTSAGDLPNLEINKSSGTLTLASTIRTAHHWTYTAGTLDTGTSNVVFAGTLTIAGSHTLNDVTFTNTSHKTIATGTQLIASGTVVLTDGFIDTGTLEAKGNTSQNSAFDGGTGLIRINGTGNQTLTGGGSTTTGDLPNLEINKSSGALALVGTIRTAHHWTYTAGTLDAGTSNVVFAGTLTIAGSHSLYDIELTSTSHKTIASGTHLTTNGTVVLTNGFLDTGTIDAKGNITQTSGFDGGTGLILINSPGNQTFTGGGSNTAGQLPAITINKSSGTLTLASVIRATNHWTYVAGNLDAAASTVVFAASLTVSGSHTLNAAEIRGAATIASGTTLALSSTLNMPSSTAFTVDGAVMVSGAVSLTDGSIAGAGAVHVQSDITQSSTFDGGSGTIIVDGTGNQTLTGGGNATAGSLPNINVNKSSGSLSLSGVIRTGGNWIHTAGTVNAIPSTVVFAGTTTQSLGGTAVTTFDNLTVDNVNGVTLAPGPVVVGGVLTFTNGTITTGTSKVVLSPGGSLVRVSGHVNGSLQRRVDPGAAVTPVFEIGDASNYLPVTLLFGNVTGAGDLTVGTIPANHPDIATSGLQASRTIPRYWTMTNSGVAFDTCSSTFQFAAADVPTGADPNQFIVAKKNATWTIPTIAAKGPTFIQTSGMTSFSDFVVGEAFTGPTTLSLASGSNQIGAIGMALGSPLVVTVTDSGNAPLAGISVTFNIASSPLGAVGQSLTVTSALTNAIGQASTTLTLGSGPGPYSVTATAAGLTGSVTFTATAVLPSPVPEITGFQPEPIVAGTLGIRLTVVGFNFVGGSVVRWNGSDRATSYVSSNQLTVGVSDSDLYSARSVTITVFNPTPGGGLSAPRFLTIHAPAPVIGQLDPPTVTVGSPEFALVVYGERFETGSIVRWNGSDRSTSYVSRHQLNAHISSSDLAKTGSALITVFNPSFGGELSNEHVFAVMPAAELRSLSLTPSSPQVDATVVGTVTLSVPAPNGGIAITLLSSDAALAATSKMLVIPAGSSSATFDILTSRVEEPTSIVISGSYQSVTVTANLVLGKSAQRIAPAQLFVPIVLRARGIGDSFYTTELTLANRGSTPAVVDFDYTPTLGTGRGTASDILPAGRQRVFPDAIAYLKSIGVPLTGGGDHGGTLKVRFSGVSDSSDVMIIARTTTRGADGRAGLAYSGVRQSELLSEPAYLCGLRQDGRDRSNVAVQNAGDRIGRQHRLATHRLFRRRDWLLPRPPFRTLNSSQETFTKSMESSHHSDWTSQPAMCALKGSGDPRPSTRTQ